MDGVAHKLLTKLRSVAPHKVRVFDGSDDYRDVAVPSRRKKWSQVIETIEAKAWTRVVMLDRSGAELGYIENDGPPSGIEEIGPDNSKGNRERWLLDLMLRAQAEALRARSIEHRDLMAGMRDLMAVQTESMKGLLQLLAMQRDVAADIAAQRTRLELEDQDPITQIMKALEHTPEAMKAIAPIIMALRAGKASKPKLQPPAQPNGESKPAGGAS